MASFEKLLELVKEHLDSEETIHESIYGVYEGKLLGSEVTRDGILVATEKRIVFFARKLGGFDLETFPFKNISSIEKSKAMMGHKVTIFASGNKVSLKWINEGNVASFAEFVNAKITLKDQKSAAVSLKESEIIGQIEKLGELKEKGILTEEEFNNKKKDLLARL